MKIAYLIHRNTNKQMETKKKTTPKNYDNEELISLIGSYRELYNQVYDSTYDSDSSDKNKRAISSDKQNIYSNSMLDFVILCSINKNLTIENCTAQ